MRCRLDCLTESVVKKVADVIAGAAVLCSRECTSLGAFPEHYGKFGFCPWNAFPAGKRSARSLPSVDYALIAAQELREKRRRVSENGTMKEGVQSCRIRTLLSGEFSPRC
jgi:hypothetical protein